MEFQRLHVIGKYSMNRVYSDGIHLKPAPDTGRLYSLYLFSRTQAIRVRYEERRI